MIFSGAVISRRFEVTTEWLPKTIPADCANVLLKNCGTEIVFLKSDLDLDTDYFCIAPGATLPIITASGGITMKFKSAANTSTIAALVWG